MRNNLAGLKKLSRADLYTVGYSVYFLIIFLLNMYLFVKNTLSSKV